MKTKARTTQYTNRDLLLADRLGIPPHEAAELLREAKSVEKAIALHHEKRNARTAAMLEPLLKQTAILEELGCTPFRYGQHMETVAIMRGRHTEKLASWTDEDLVRVVNGQHEIYKWEHGKSSSPYFTRTPQWETLYQKYCEALGFEWKATPKTQREATDARLKARRAAVPLPTAGKLQ